jgi:hypothetical protein
MDPLQNSIPACIKTACGQAKYRELAAHSGWLARLRLVWFVAIAALRDWRLPDDNENSTKP